jgi:hypothetical protein
MSAGGATIRPRDQVVRRYGSVIHAGAGLCAVRRCWFEWRWETFASGLSQQVSGAGGSLIRVVPGRVGAAPTKPGRASTARWCGPGERDGEEYVRNRRCYVPQSFTGSNLADLGRMRCVSGHVGGELRGWCGPAARGGHGEGLRRTRGDTAGTQSGSSFVERIAVNTGTVWDLACRRAAGVEGWAGRTDRRPVRDGAEPP